MARHIGCGKLFTGLGDGAEAGQTLVIDGDPLADISVLQDRARIREIIQGGEMVNIEINKNARRLRSEFSYDMWSDVYTQARIDEIGMARGDAQRAVE